MKTKKVLITLMIAAFTSPLLAQLQPDLQYFRPNDQRGINVFETSKTDTVGFDGVKVRVGGDFALQFQSLDHSNENNTLIDLGSNFNLPTANLNLNAQLYDGMRLHLRTYLSSRHHAESWVKGGYLQVDKLDFIKEGFLKGFMDIATIRVGMDEFGYGDLVYRRTDNASAIYNPFIGNYIMDSFSTEAFGEVIVQKNGFLGLVGLTNGKLNQSVVINDKSDNQPSIFAKLGYDKQVNEDLRVRLTASIYTNGGETTGQWMYNGDRAGARYYKVMHDTSGAGSDFDPRFNPNFRQMTAIQINPFVKYKGLEFFGVYEIVSGTTLAALSNSELGDGSYTQLGAELLYRFGTNENLYVGGRYNMVSGESTGVSKTNEIDRLNLGLGWFMTKNVLAKIEYMNQNYSGDGYIGSRFENGNIQGIMIEAVIGF
ncbi:hypothetical protein G3O08_06425 [Cryomorpha ignava]|uniref:Porin n=1 Tax=Cryomorpha ignava TaxID=101383 RepID=A0A7K3WQH3_9FLAO|nr:hypothetical protein [Cryomorpha ignava]NEN23132.1 hypothetical protein [Cryomorpha ignava]